MICSQMLKLQMLYREVQVNLNLATLKLQRSASNWIEVPEQVTGGGPLRAKGEKMIRSLLM